MAIACEITERAAQFTLAVRGRAAVGDLPGFFGGAYGAVMQYLAGQGEAPAGPPFALYHNVDMQNLDVEAGFPVERALPGAGDVKPGELPPGRAATCLHVGPYDDLPASYGALERFVKEQGVRPSGLVLEFYLNDPGTVAPAELQTQIVFPLA